MATRKVSPPLWRAILFMGFFCRKRENCSENIEDSDALSLLYQKDLPGQEVFLVFTIIPTGELGAGEDSMLFVMTSPRIIPTGELGAGED